MNVRLASLMRFPALLSSILLLAAPAVAQGDPGDEAANQASCTGTCDTCPGKAQAIVELAGYTRALLKVDGLDTKDEAAQVRETLGGFDGLQSCVAFADESWVWLAFDADAVDMPKISSTLDGLGFGVNSVILRAEPMQECSEGCERVAVYLLLPESKDALVEALQSFEMFAGVDQLSYDRAFNLLVLDLDPELTEASQIRDQIVERGYAAGLPGEDLLQPAPAK